MARFRVCAAKSSSLLMASAMLAWIVAYHSLAAQPGDRRGLFMGKPPASKGRILILLDVNTKSPIRTVSDNFLSVQLDPSIIHDGWLDFLSSKRLVTLARGLAPAFLRFGGKRTDFLQFQNLKNPAKSRGGPGPDYYLKNYEDECTRKKRATMRFHQRDCINNELHRKMEAVREENQALKTVLLNSFKTEKKWNCIRTTKNTQKKKKLW